MSAVVAYMVLKNRRVKAAKRANEQGGRGPAPSFTRRGVPAQPERVPDTEAARATYAEYHAKFMQTYCCDARDVATAEAPRSRLQRVLGARKPKPAAKVGMLPLNYEKWREMRKHESEAQLAIAIQGGREMRERLGHGEVRGVLGTVQPAGASGPWIDEDDDASTLAPSEYSEMSADFQLHDFETAAQVVWNRDAALASHTASLVLDGSGRRPQASWREGATRSDDRAQREDLKLATAPDMVDPDIFVQDHDGLATVAEEVETEEVRAASRQVKRDVDGGLSEGFVDSNGRKGCNGGSEVNDIIGSVGRLFSDAAAATSATVQGVAGL